MNKIIVFIAVTTILLGCNTPEKQSATVEKPEVVEQTNAVETTHRIPDSVIVSVAMQGEFNRMDILQQKVMHKAKVALADSLRKLQALYADSTVSDSGNYEVGLHDIHVLKEGVRYPEAGNRSKIEAYITLGVKFQ